MIPYWLIFLMPVLAVISPFKIDKSTQRILWVLFIVFLTCFIGFRHEVGGDWRHYLYNYNHINEKFHPFNFLFATTDYGFDILSWVFYNAGFNIYAFNFLNAIIFMIGLSSYALRQPQPALNFVVAIPYLVIVVATGYTRQATAIGFIFLGIIALTNNNWRLFFVYILLASMFHKTAIFMIVLILAVSPKLNYKFILAIVFIFIIIAFYYYFVLRIKLFNLIYFYTGDGNYFYSRGALVRVLIHLVPAFLCIFLQKNLSTNNTEKKIYLLMAYIVIISLFFVNIYSSAIDRMLLYIMPLQLFIFSRLHIIFKTTYYRRALNIGVVSMYLIVLIGWISFGRYSKAWIPYDYAFF